MSIKKWIKAFRLRTLPLSLSGIITSYFYFEYAEKDQNILVFSLALVTTLFLQILSNLANDYGDGKKGTDNENRIGPERGIQSGAISLSQMKTAIIIFSLLSFASGCIMLFVAFGLENLVPLLIFLGLGLSAILAAMKYTMGNSAYGYRAMGDVFVLIFFGFVAVTGFYLLVNDTINIEIILLSIVIGAFSTLVLNLNNMRDVVNDKASGKTTLAVIFGFNGAKVYHFLLILLIVISIIIFNLKTGEFLIWWNCLIFIPMMIHVMRVSGVSERKEFDPELKKVALTTFAFALLNSILLHLC